MAEEQTTSPEQGLTGEKNLETKGSITLLYK